MSYTTADSIHSGRYTAAQIAAILDRLDAMEQQAVDHKRRQALRFVYRLPDLTLRLTQPGGGVSDCTVQSRNLSATGLSFLYTGFLYPGTDVKVWLRRFTGGQEMVAGKVAWCRHLTGPLHSCGIKFSARVFHKLYIDPSLDDPTNPAERVDPASVKGAVLMLDDQRMDRLLFEHSLQGTQIKVVTVATCEEAIKRLQAEPFDVFVSDLNLVEMTGEQAFAKVRAGGFKGALIALTAETQPRRIHAAQTAGAAAVLAKPYEVDRLLATLAAFLEDVGTAPDQLIHSTLAIEKQFQPVLKQYVDSVKGAAADIRHAVEQNDFRAVRSRCQELKGSAAGFGFAQISDVARDVGKVLDTSHSVAESVTQIEHLLQLCRRVTATPK